jgi:hypothetical protein
LARAQVAKLSTLEIENWARLTHPKKLRKALRPRTSPPRTGQQPARKGGEID